MKKIFYFIASAIVALGAVACQNQFDEEFTPNTQNEGLSFTAAIDEETRITFNGMVTSWEAGDCIMIDGYEFTTTNGSSFSCTADGVRSLIGKKIEAVYSYNNDGLVDSKQAEKGAVLKATGTMLEANTTLTFSPQSAYLNFTSMQGDVVLNGKGLFVVDGETADEFTVVNKYGPQYVAINPTNEEIEFSYTYGDNPGKTIQKQFVAGKVYYLGTLSAAVAMVDGVNYTDLSKALAAAGTTKVVTLLADATDVATACVINANGHNLTTGDGYLALKNYKTENMYDVVAVTTPNTWRLAGYFGGTEKWEISTGAQYMKQIDGTNIYVAKNVALKSGDFFKFFKGANTYSEWVGSYTGEDGNDSKTYTTLQDHPKTNKYEINNSYNNSKGNFGVTAEGNYDIYIEGTNQYQQYKIWVQAL